MDIAKLKVFLANQAQNDVNASLQLQGSVAAYQVVAKAIEELESEQRIPAVEAPEVPVEAGAAQDSQDLIPDIDWDSAVESSAKRGF